MDIEKNLTTYTQGDSAYTIRLIEDTFNNYINISKIYFFKLYKNVNFNDLVGETSTSSEIRNLELYMNTMVTQSFKNLALKVQTWTFVEDPENNLLTLQCDLTCDLLGVPNQLSFNVPLNV